MTALAQSSQDTFGTGANQFTMDFRMIGNPGNADDVDNPFGEAGLGDEGTPYGGVDYVYRLGTYEVSRGMIDAYNANNGGPVIDMADMSSFGGSGAYRPATGLSWNEAARFVNWLNTSSGYSAAYKFTTIGGNDNIELWMPSDPGYDAANPFRNSNAYYFLPSEDEWYKGAYYDPDANGGAGGYWDFATGSNTAPLVTSGGTASGTAVYRDFLNPNPPGPADVDNAGGLSAYGTMAQSGNVWEWGESGLTAPNDSAGESRVTRGGGWFIGSGDLSSTARGTIGAPTLGSAAIGFRVASVPKPTLYSLDFVSLTNGSVTGAGDYDPDVTTEIEAIPDPGYLFSEWTGDASGTQNPLTITMDSNKTIGATFVPDLADDDNDGLTNLDEITLHGTSPIVSDSDNDGYLDGFEVTNQTDPGDESSVPFIELTMELSEFAGIPTIDLNIVPPIGGQFSIEESLNMRDWEPIMFFTGDGESFTTIELQPSSERAYYRLKLLEQRP